MSSQINPKVDIEKSSVIEPTLKSLIEARRRHADSLTSKAKFKEKHEDILTEQKLINKEALEHERDLRAQLALYVANRDAVHISNAKEDNPVTLPSHMSHEAKLIVAYDEQTAIEWAIRFAPYLLTIQVGAFEDMVKAHDGIDSRFKARQVLATTIPAAVNRVVNPILASSITQAASDSDVPPAPLDENMANTIDAHLTAIGWDIDRQKSWYEMYAPEWKHTPLETKQAAPDDKEDS